MPLTAEKAQPPSAHDPGSSSSSSHPTIDDGYFYSEAEKNLHEVAAPPPVLDRSEGYIRQHDYLENIRSSTSRNSAPPENGDEAQPEAIRRRSTHGGSVWTSYHSKTLNKVINYCYLVFFAIAGTLTRIVIEAVTYYPGAPVSTSVLWANMGGSFIMGFLSEDQALFRIETHHEDESTRRSQHIAHKKTIPLYIGLTTGFCGCLTSFSTFERDVFLALTNNLSVPVGPYSDLSILSQKGAGTLPGGGFSFMAILAVIITEVGLSLTALKAGAHFAIFGSSWLPRIRPMYLRRLLNPLVIVLAPVSLIVSVCLVVLLPKSGEHQFSWDPAIWRGPFLFSLVFAPAGCLARYFLSLKLNRYITQFPLGTFVANLGGTMILGMAFSLQHSPLGSSGLGGGSMIGCQVLQGIMDGFCGSMTTVSTWVLELSDSRRGHAYVYGILSVVVPLVLLVIEAGSLRWTQGFVSPACYSSN